MLERRLTELGDVPESLTRADAAARELHERLEAVERAAEGERTVWVRDRQYAETKRTELLKQYEEVKEQRDQIAKLGPQDRKSTRLNSSHSQISYAGLRLKNTHI